MGNSPTALAQFYAPPEPATPLAREKYFWIDSLSGRDDGGDGTGTATPPAAAPLPEGVAAIAASLVARGAGRRAIPAVYIARGCSGVPATEAHGRDGGARCTLLYCHGHDVDLGLIYDFLIHLGRVLGVDILSFEYAGYGLSTRGRRPPARDDEDEDDGLDSSFRYDCSYGQEAPSDGRGDGPPPRGAATADDAYDDAAISGRAPTEEQCCLDVLACYSFLVRRGVPPENVILYGKSLGSGPACWLAHRLLCGSAAVEAEGDEREGPAGGAGRVTAPHAGAHGRSATPVPRAFLASRRPSPAPPLAGLVLHSAFLSIDRLRGDAARPHPPHPYLPAVVAPVPARDAFDNVTRLRALGGAATTLPVYLIHGAADAVVPLTHGAGLFAALMSGRRRGFPPFWADGGTHWNIEHKYATAYIKRLQQFLRHCAKVKSSEGYTSRSKNCPPDTSVPLAQPLSLLPQQQQRQDETDSPLRAGAHHDSPLDDSGKIQRPRFNVMPHHHRNRLGDGTGGGHGGGHGGGASHRVDNSHSSKAARHRRKKGTLVMRGDHEQEAPRAKAGRGEPRTATLYPGTAVPKGGEWHAVKQSLYTL